MGNPAPDISRRPNGTPPPPPKRPGAIAAARTLSEAHATPLMQLDLIVARMSFWLDRNQKHARHGAAALEELMRLRGIVADAGAPPLVRLGPGGDFTTDPNGDRRCI